MLSSIAIQHLTFISLYFISPLNILSDVHTGIMDKGNGRMTIKKDFFPSTDTLRRRKGDTANEESFV